MLVLVLVLGSTTRWFRPIYAMVELGRKRPNRTAECYGNNDLWRK